MTNYKYGAATGICTVEGCSKQKLAKFLCSTHYRRMRLGLDLDAPIRSSNGYFNLHTVPMTRTKAGYNVFNVPKQGPSGEYLSPGIQIKEHQFVMMRALGRELLPGETVHHKNGVKFDNRLDNLELWVTTQPAGQRPEDLVLWAREILQRYEPTKRRITLQDNT